MIDDGLTKSFARDPGEPVWFYPCKSEPTLNSEIQADLCVVGLGGSGLAAVEAALDAGLSVVGIDANRIARSGAGRNGGLLLAGTAKFYPQAVANHGRQRIRALYQITLDEITRIHQRDPDLVQLNGCLRRANGASEIEECRHQLALLNEDGFSARWYKGFEGEGVLSPGDATFQPYALCLRNVQRLKKRGAQLFEETPAVQLDGDCVTTPLGKIRATYIVVTVDGGLERVFPELKNQVHSVRLQMLATAPVPSLKLNHAVYFRDGLDYWQQLPNQSIVLGGGRDYDVDANTNDSKDEHNLLAPTEQVQRYLVSLLDKVVGAPEQTRITHHWAGNVAYSANALPILQEIRQRIFVAGAYSGHGNILGRLLGRELVHMCLGNETEISELLTSHAE